MAAGICCRLTERGVCGNGRVPSWNKAVWVNLEDLWIHRRAVMCGSESDI